MNQLHSIAAISRLVVQGKDASQVYHNLRESMDLEAVGLSRSKVEKQAKDAIEAFGSFTLPIEKRKFEVDADETELRADIIDALQQVDLSSASVVRELHALTRDIIGSSGFPTLVQGLDMLDELEVDTLAMRGRLSSLGFAELEPDEAGTADSTGLIDAVTPITEK